MKKNQLIRLLCFCLCIITVMLGLSKLFHYEKAGGQFRNAVLGYSDLPKGTVDVVAIGTSGIHCSYIPGKAYNDYGMTSYGLTIDGMQAWDVVPMMKYARETQNPKLYVIDMRPFTVSDATGNMEARSRYFNEIFPMFSKFRFMGINESLKYLSRYTDTGRFDLSYYFTVLRYHDMWQDDLSFGVLKKGNYFPYGFRLTKAEFKVKKLEDSVYTKDKLALTDFAAECLQNVFDYAEENGLELLFVYSPRSIDESISARKNTLCEILDSKGYPYVDMASPDSEKTYKFDKTTDFRDKSHTNYYGAEKFTCYLTEYIINKYDIEDRRSDGSCDCFAAAYKKVLKKAASLEKQIAEEKKDK